MSSQAFALDFCGYSGNKGLVWALQYLGGFILDDVETTFALFDGSMKALPKDFSSLNTKTKWFKPLSSDAVMIILVLRIDLALRQLPRARLINNALLNITLVSHIHLPSLVPQLLLDHFCKSILILIHPIQYLNLVNGVEMK